MAIDCLRLRRKLLFESFAVQLSALACYSRQALFAPRAANWQRLAYPAPGGRGKRPVAPISVSLYASRKHLNQPDDPAVRDGRREFLVLATSAILVQVGVGLVAVHDGAATIPWPSLVIRPAVTLALVLMVARLGRASAILSGWLGLLAIGYAVGVTSAHSPLLALARGIAFIDMGFGACWLQASHAIRKYFYRRRS